MALHPIIIRDLSLVFPNKICFENFSADIYPGSSVAVIGDNGSGKTSLLNFIAGLESRAEGRLIIPQGCRLAFVPQIIEDRSYMSGGERFNAALTAALSKRPDLLLLDEPTNHLDAANRHSLMNMLASFRNTVIAATHDRELLGLFGTLWNIDGGRIEVFNGDYGDYIKEKESLRHSLESRRRSLEAEEKEMHSKLMREQERAAKSRSKGEKDKKNGKWAPIVANNIKRSAQVNAGKKKSGIGDRKKEIIEQINGLGFREEISPSFNIPAGSVSGSALFIMNGEAGYEGSPVLRGINLNLGGKDRIAIVGNNACGKTTLFRAVMNGDFRLGGVWRTPRKEDTGYLDQHYGNVAPEETAETAVSRLVPEWTCGDIRRHLNGFLFRKNEEVSLPAKFLSGGEKARLSLALIACRVPKLLLLDEITNNIDMRTRAYAGQILKSYPGAMILISHDADFIRDTGIEDIYIIENGRLKRA